MRGRIRQAELYLGHWRKGDSLAGRCTDPWHRSHDTMAKPKVVSLSVDTPQNKASRQDIMMLYRELAA